MKTPIEWLSQYALIREADQALKEKMMWLGFGTEEIQRPGDEVENVVIGRLLSLAKHPNADALQVCSVDVGSGTPLQIVTGATNVKAGDLVPVAVHGARLPGGKRISRGKLRGELSEGMLCSGSELNVPDDLYPGAGEDGILRFQEEYPLGSDVRAIFGLSGSVFDFEVLPNRPDCQCVLGLAREAAVGCGADFKAPAVAVREAAGGDMGALVRVRIDAPDLCQRYAARAVRDIRVAPSPLWMRARLHAAGVRPINNIVDVTNYVMLEMGHPMHAFDLAALEGEQIVVRRATAGEMLRTLDDKDRLLSPDMLVIADAEKPVAIGGVMGGASSQITKDTSVVLLECARFAQASVRVTSRALGLRSESSMRFEKGVSEHTVLQALDRAAQLIEEIGAGRVVKGVVDVWPSPKALPDIRCSCAQIRSLCGVDVSDERIEDILRRLGFSVTRSGASLTVAPPAYRQDVSHWSDLAEEVLRVHGYQHIQGTLPRIADARGKRSQRQAQNSALKHTLAALGLCEITTFSFISPKAFALLGLAPEDGLQKAARILNPLGEDYSLMRTTLAPSMLDTIALNQSRGAGEIRLFEVAARYLPRELPLADLPDERQTLCLGLAGTGVDFYAAKSLAEAVLAHARVQNADYRAGGPSYMHPGRCARISAGEACLGYVGELHPDVAERYGLRGRVGLMEIDLPAMRESSVPMTEAQPLPKYPAVSRDLALVMEDAVPVGDAMRVLQTAGMPLLENVALFDTYRSAALGEGKKSLAFALSFRAPDRTLTDQEVQAVMERLLHASREQLGAQLRV